ncbi:uncharacterized protein MELLADRAFT_102190 [Melampsora larici-populina 98AG31]|uniref:Uncharacterized protein n=1 Tax=Melampsora larici-populina (strain 98AG31 / pathotype 3-4-7) TaxID=747676 RepID=F4R7H3_MELLP|nr:uncharacterized protein MELLADRAFT_102190 [Melampsora larici-populina 98AG31]EGG11317.1 hypothetical protein MELLADRAFT_102190 [Melampsora larici-populina 98AG31]
MAQNVPKLPRFFESVSSNPAVPLYKCNACQSRNIVNYERHSNSEPHKINVERLLAKEADNEELLAPLSHAPALSPSNNQWPEDAMETDDESDHLGDSILDVLELLGPILSDDDNSSNSGSETEQRQLLFQALEMLDQEDLGEEEDDAVYEAMLDSELAEAKKEESKDYLSCTALRSEPRLKYRSKIPAILVKFNQFGNRQTNQLQEVCSWSKSKVLQQLDQVEASGLSNGLDRGK